MSMIITVQVDAPQSGNWLRHHFQVRDENTYDHRAVGSLQKEFVDVDPRFTPKPVT